MPNLIIVCSKCNKPLKEIKNITKEALTLRNLKHEKELCTEHPMAPNAKIFKDDNNNILPSSVWKPLLKGKTPPEGFTDTITT